MVILDLVVKLCQRESSWACRHISCHRYCTQEVGGVRMHFGKEMVGCICTGFWGIGVNGSGILIVIHILAIQENDKVQHQRLAIVHIG